MEEDSKGESSMKALTRRGFIGMAATAGMAVVALGVTKVLNMQRRANTIVAVLVGVAVYAVLALAVGNLVVPGNTDAIAGMVIEFCVPMGVTGLMWVDIYNGNRSFGLAVVVISTVLAPLTMPLTIQLLMGATVHVDLVAMMLDLLIMISLPAVAGMACNDLSHGKANARVAPWLAPASKIMLVLILATNSTRISGSIHHFTP